MTTPERYFGSFDKRDDLIENFFRPSNWDEKAAAPEGFPEDAEILFASYGGAAYEGDALVLYEQRGTLYEVHGSHCSCYGLEGQWSPEETSWAALALRARPTEHFHDLRDHDAKAVEAFWALVDSHTAVES